MEEMSRRIRKYMVDKDFWPVAKENLQLPV